MKKYYSINIRLTGDISNVELNIDNIVSSIDYMGIDDCFIHVYDFGMIKEGDSDDA